MNLANKLTLLRVIMIPAFLAVLYLGSLVELTTSVDPTASISPWRFL